MLVYIIIIIDMTTLFKYSNKLTKISMGYTYYSILFSDEHFFTLER